MHKANLLNIMRAVKLISVDRLIAVCITNPLWDAVWSSVGDPV